MGHNILYIEDNADNMLLIIRALKSRKYNVFQAENGLDGLSMIEQNSIDLVLLDINLPDIDGYEVARRLRKNDNSDLAKTPIIAITANALEEDAKLSLDAGCNVYMAKPINIRELLDRINDFVPAPE